MLSHPRSHFLYVVAWLGVWSLCWFALLLVGILLVFCFHWAILFAVALCIFFINMFVFLPLAFSFRCPHCDRFVLVQDWRTLQPARKRVLAALGLASWVAVVFDIVLNHEFTCMHCAERCLVNVNTDSTNSLARHDD
jgi:hypothetical protein